MVHRRFVPNLRLILSNSKLQKRFRPFFDLIQLSSDFSAYDALARHVQYQRWLFEEANVFGREPFSLQEVYIDTECGSLRWGEIKGSLERTSDGAAGRDEVADPFSEKWGGRAPLLDRVIRFLQDPAFFDAVVIQGAAGSGKSSFTLKLCAHLEREGLYPIRVRLRDLSLNDPLDEALPRALFPPDRELPTRFQGGAGEDPFRRGAIFREKTQYGTATICPYVLILDGWDEISISATEGFKVRVARMLEEVRATYLRNTATTVRVILTGRPSSAVAESRFLLNGTPVLTIRPIRPDQLETFVDDLRISLSKTTHVSSSATAEWTVPARETWKPLFEKYAADYKAKIERELKGDRTTATSGTMDVLGLPLLAQLAVRMVSVWPGPRDELIESPTTLYRYMVDLTCVKGGKSPDDPFSNEESAFVTGRELRTLLQQTAAAMSVYGQESISFQELALRLKLEDAELDRRATTLSDTHVLSGLMISFFFKGGHQNLGCEFLHKSFREYLFAEAIIETLKRFGRDNRPTQTRADYWKDFENGSRLYEFSRSVAELLAPQWLSPEVAQHLESLLIWEVNRRHAEKEAAMQEAGQPTDRITYPEWVNVRDSLAELWHWWGEGVHLRPQPELKARTRDLELRPAYVEELVEHDLPYDPAERKRRFAPARSTTMDAHLGDGLFRLNCIVHFELLQRTQWLDHAHSRDGFDPARLWENVERSRARSTQSTRVDGGKSWVFFAPSGSDPRFFDFHKARINAAGWRPVGPFPSGLLINGVDLRGCNIAIPFNAQTGTPDGRPTNWRFCNLSRAYGTLGYFNRCDFSFVFATGSYFEACALSAATFTGADFSEAWLNYSILAVANLTHARLSGAQLNSVYIKDADFSDAALDAGALVDAHGAPLNVANHALHLPRQAEPAEATHGGEPWPAAP